MASVCISTCVDDVRVPVRASYVNKWPESDFEFVRSMSSKTQRDVDKSSIYGRPRVVDSISCRQLYLRSYTFSREEDYIDGDGGNGDTLKCLGRKAAGSDKESRKVKKVKSSSCSSLASIFRGLLSCTVKVDVAD